MGPRTDLHRPPRQGSSASISAAIDSPMPNMRIRLTACPAAGGPAGPQPRLDGALPHLLELPGDAGEGDDEGSVVLQR